LAAAYRRVVWNGSYPMPRIPAIRAEAKLFAPEAALRAAGTAQFGNCENFVKREIRRDFVERNAETT